MTAENQETTTNPKILAPHLLMSAALSLLLPGCGAEYLGMPTRRPPRVIVLLAGIFGIAFLSPLIIDFNLVYLALLAGFWLLAGCRAIAREWRWARANPLLVRIEIQSSVYYGPLLLMGYFLIMSLGSPVPQLPVFFLAPNATPAVDRGDLLYGFEYNEQSFHITRGQLLLANVNGERALARVIGVPGDIAAVGSYSVYVNANIVRPKYAGSTSMTSIAENLQDFVQDLAYPNGELLPAAFEGNKLAFRGAAPAIIGADNYLVSFDNDLMSPQGGVPSAKLITNADIIAVPWARFWILGTTPGDDSDIAQPAVIRRQ